MLPLRGGRGSWRPRSRVGERPAQHGGDADQDRDPVGLPGRVRRVRRAGPRRRRRRDVAVRGREAGEPEQAAQGHGRAARSAGIRSSSSASAARNDRADTAIKETKRLMEQLGADVMIGPLSGDESIAVANYAKQHPTKTFVDGSAGAQDTTLKVQAPNFFRFNGDGAQWNAGLGDLAYNKLGWKTAAVIADDYSFAWTSAAGFIAEFCAVGGKITKRVFPPLNTTDYSSYAQQLPTRRRRHLRRRRRRGPDPVPQGVRAGARPDRRQEVHRQPVLGHAGPVRAARRPRRRRLRRRRRHRRRPRHEGGEELRERVIGKWFKKIPPLGAAAPQASSTFTFGYFINTWGLIKGLQAVKGDISGGQKTLQKALGKVVAADGRTARSSSTRTARRSSPSTTSSCTPKDGKLAVKTVGDIPNVDQTFGGTFSRDDAAAGPQLPDVREALASVGRQDAASEGHRRSERMTAAAPPSTPRRSSACGGSAGASAASTPCATSISTSRTASAAPSSGRTAREDDAVQRHLRRHRADLGDDRVPRRRTSTLAPAAHARQARDGADVPEVAPLPRPFGRGQPLPRACSASAPGHLRPVVLPGRDGAIRERARELAAVVGLGGEAADARRLALARRAAPARGGDGAGRRTRS